MWWAGVFLLLNLTAFLLFLSPSMSLLRLLWSFWGPFFFSIVFASDLPKASTIYMLLGNKSCLKSLPDLCLNTCLGLSLVLLLLKSTNSSACTGRSQQWRADQHCSVCPHLRQVFLLCSGLPVSKFCLSFSAASLHSFPSVYSDRSKKQVSLSMPSSYLYCCIDTVGLVCIQVPWDRDFYLLRFHSELLSYSQKRASMDLSCNLKLHEVSKCFRKERVGSGMGCMLTNTQL